MSEPKEDRETAVRTSETAAYVPARASTRLALFKGKPFPLN